MSWLLVQQGKNPSSDYFVRPALAGSQVQMCNLDEPPNGLPAPGTHLVFVRYLTPQWRRWVERHRAVLGRLAFFMDDDLFDVDAHRTLPLRYRWKLYRLATRHKAWLRRMNAELWVSTQWLADKYSGWQPRVLAPQPPYADCLPQKTFFYHGSASHMGEIRWLVPVVEEVLKRDLAYSFEIIGNTEIRKLFSHLPRVHVLQPMSWPAYQALVSRPGRVVGLAPLFPGPFNQARSPTKFFDITQAGAAGLYADHPVYRSLIRHGENGLLLPMNQADWVEAILELGQDEPLRKRLLASAKGSDPLGQAPPSPTPLIRASKT
jgi:glycosyltransferase involved in cell wall biosynthesis